MASYLLYSMDGHPVIEIKPKWNRILVWPLALSFPVKPRNPCHHGKWISNVDDDMLSNDFVICVLLVAIVSPIIYTLIVVELVIVYLLYISCCIYCRKCRKENICSLKYLLARITLNMWYTMIEHILGEQALQDLL